MDFAQVETKFKELKEKYDAGALTEAEFKAQLEELMVQDEQGRWWMIGYETGQWYYHDGEKWAPGEPSQVDEVQRIQPDHRYLEALLVTTIGWGIGFVIGTLIGAAIGWGIGWTITGAIGGLGTGLALQRTQSSVQWKQPLMIACGWTVSLYIGWIIILNIGGATGGNIIWAIAGAIAGAIGGVITGLVLQRVELSIQKRQILVITSG